MAKDTKERILSAALEMFAQKGYEGTNIRELSASLGLVKSGIYKHYESKEEIWNALLDRMIAYYGERFGSPKHNVPAAAIVADPLLKKFQKAGEEYAAALRLSAETVAELEKPMISAEEYIRNVNGI